MPQQKIDEIDVLWITAGLGCDGHTISMTAATQPSIEDLILGALPGIPRMRLHNPFLSRASWRKNGAGQFRIIFMLYAASRLRGNASTAFRVTSYHWETSAHLDDEPVKFAGSGALAHPLPFQGERIAAVQCTPVFASGRHDINTIAPACSGVAQGHAIRKIEQNSATRTRSAWSFPN